MARLAGGGISRHEIAFWTTGGAKAVVKVKNPFFRNALEAAGLIGASEAGGIADHWPAVFLPGLQKEFDFSSRAIRQTSRINEHPIVRTGGAIGRAA